MPLFPLSYNQQASWHLYQLTPQSWAYNLLFAARIHSYISIPALQAAVAALVERHASLRSTYTGCDGSRFQQIHQHGQAGFEQIDAATWNQDELNEHLLEAAHRPFNLEQGPLLRVHLFTQAPTSHLLLLAVHHIAADFWSLTILLDELGTLYSAHHTDIPALPPLEFSYTDYIRWQQQMLATPAGEELWSYWENQLAGELPVLNFPTDRPRPPVQTYAGASHTFKLSAELTRDIKQLAQAESATLYMALLAAFQVLLYRYTGQEDILVGSPTTGRTRREFAEIVGNFINPVVLRADLSGNPTFKTFLNQVRQIVRSALQHQDFPFRLLVERLHLPQDSSRSPLFQVMLVLHELHRCQQLIDFIIPHETDTRIDFGGIELEPFTVTQQEGQLDLTLEMIESEGRLCGVWKYNTDLFNAATISRLAEHFQTLLAGVVANPNQPIATLPLLTTAEQEQLLVAWNSTQSEYPKLCVHQLFEAQAARTPDAVAVVFEEESLTYRELNCRANSLAHYLRDLGVGPEVLVGIALERSLLMLVGLLGILKAGGAYVPLDPAYPQERLDFMIEDAQVSVLLTQERLRSQLAKPEMQLVCLDSDWQKIAQHSQASPTTSATADNLVYVLYTSGSTGKPKGVQIRHYSVVNFLHSMLEQPGLTPRDVLLAVTSLSFDIAVLELFLPLVVGAKLVVVSREVATSGTQLLAALQGSQATVMQATPATWRLLLAAGWQGSSQLKVLCGGEALAPELANQLLKRSKSVWNLYGPTETTIWSTVAEVKFTDDRVPIGRPIANTQIYLLDSQLQPVPIGVPGELYIGGAGLARGYLNRPELTALKFIANPFSPKSETRLYRTGDLACYLPNAKIRYLGRLDHQVKLRGFRLELGEIEAVLSQHPAVQQTVVVARQDITDNQRLVAYIVPQVSQLPTPGELRRYLQQQLPDYMVPSAFVFLDSLPLTPNGKVDRRALPAPITHPQRENTFVAPQTPVELQLTQIWEKVLGIQPIGIKDNFFELGGHSLLALGLFAEIEQIFGKKLPLTLLLQAPTVAQLAKVLAQADNARASSLVLLNHGHKPPLFCIYGILLYQELARQLGNEQTVYGVYLEEEVELLKADRFAKPSSLTSVAQLAALYLKEIRLLQPRGPYFLAGESFGGLVAFEIAQQLHQQGEKVALLALLDTPFPTTSKRMSLTERTQLHLKKFLQTGPSYVLAKVMQRIKLGQNHFSHIIKRIYQKIDYRNAQILPNHLSEFGIQDVRQQFCDQLMSKYLPSPYQGKMLLFRATDVSEFEAYSTDPKRGWGAIPSAGLEVYNVPGDHLGILKQPHVQVLADKLKACLEQAQQEAETQPMNSSKSNVTQKELVLL